MTLVIAVALLAGLLAVPSPAVRSVASADEEHGARLQLKKTVTTVSASLVLTLTLAVDKAGPFPRTH